MITYFICTADLRTLLFKWIVKKGLLLNTVTSNFTANLEITIIVGNNISWNAVILQN